MLTKFLKFKKAIVLGLVVLFGFVLMLAFKAKISGTEKAIALLKEKGAQPTFSTVNLPNGTINTICVGKKENPKLLFIHGSPGDWTAWSGFLGDSSLFNNYFIVAYDRAGFGETTVDAQKDLSIHGKMALDVIELYAPNEKWIIVGHSYGGAVLAYLMVQNPEIISKAILAAPAISPVYQEARWYNKLAKRTIVNKLIGSDLRSSNVEMLGLTESLLKIEGLFSEITVRQVFIHGEKDVLVPFETVAYWQGFKMKNAQFVLRKKMNHFIPWSDSELIFNAIKGIEQFPEN